MLATHPDVRLIDYTGSTSYGEWLEANASQARVFTEKAGVNCVVLDSTDDLDGLAANLAYSLSLYSGQMCTTPQTILIPRDGIDTDDGHRSVDEVVERDRRRARRHCSATRPAPSTCSARSSTTAYCIGSMRRVERRRGADRVACCRSPGVREPREFARPSSSASKRRTSSAYAHECFGPVAFVVETEDTEAASMSWRRIITSERVAHRVGLFHGRRCAGRCAQRRPRYRRLAVESTSLRDIYVNQTAAFSDYHGTGANAAANATLTDLAFVADRFRIVETRRPQ